MLKHLIRFRSVWWIIHVVFPAFVFWLGHIAQF